MAVGRWPSSLWQVFGSTNVLKNKLEPRADLWMNGRMVGYICSFSIAMGTAGLLHKRMCGRHSNMMRGLKEWISPTPVETLTRTPSGWFSPCPGTFLHVWDLWCTSALHLTRSTKRLSELLTHIDTHRRSVHQMFTIPKEFPVLQDGR